MTRHSQRRLPLAALLSVGLSLLLLMGLPSAQGDASRNTYLPMILRNPGGPSLAGCPVFPADHAWNTLIDNLPVDPNSATYVATIGANKYFHADFGSGEWQNAPIGIPFVVVDNGQPSVAIHFTAYGAESNPGPYPIPANAPIEGGPSSSGDRHVLVLDRSQCKLFELYAAYPQQDGSWNAQSGATFDLRGYALRPAGWTSADAAGLAIFPGLARYDEVAQGVINHALRFTAPNTRKGVYTWPARHFASSNASAALPQMGMRFRLKSSFNITSAPADVQVILRAMQRYGIILADNGSSWYVSGAPDPRWNNDHLHWLDGHLSGADFEAVNTASMVINPNSGQAHQP